MIYYSQFSLVYLVLFETKSAIITLEDWGWGGWWGGNGLLATALVSAMCEKQCTITFEKL